MNVEIPESLRICPGCFSEDESGIQFACLMSGPEELCCDCAAKANRIQYADAIEPPSQSAKRFTEGLICGVLLLAVVEALVKSF